MDLDPAAGLPVLNFKDEAELREFLRCTPATRIHGEKRTPTPKAPPLHDLPRDAFDSELEFRFYRKRVVPGLLTGQITGMELHRSFEIAPALEHAGKTYKARVYTPDFVLAFREGSVEVYEIKSKQVRKMQRDYPLRRHLFLEKYVIPNGWRFYEVNEHEV